MNRVRLHVIRTEPKTNTTMALIVYSGLRSETFIGGRMLRKKRVWLAYLNAVERALGDIDGSFTSRCNSNAMSYHIICFSAGDSVKNIKVDDDGCLPPEVEQMLRKIDMMF